jgi:mRNA interferase MazF
LAFITSKISNDQIESDIVIDSSAKDFGSTGLRVSSTIRLHRLMTVTTSIITRELGKLSPKMLKEVEAKLRNLFDL